MNFANIGYLFYKSYYDNFSPKDWSNLISADEGEGEGKEKATISELAQRSIAIINNNIIYYRFDSSLVDYLDLNRITGNLSIELKTTYPGLLLGSGYSHAAGRIDEEFKLGFYFDHTTGMPVIPGSSVKGIIRSAFPGSSKSFTEDEKKQREQYIKWILKENHVEEDVDVYGLEMEIFMGKRTETQESGKKKFIPVPLAQRDIFFDAYIIASENKGGVFMGEDFITPHKHKSNPALDSFANPNPIKFLKILPGVTFRFQFDLKNNGKLQGFQKLKLFKKIILDLGVGAKTNVGYGHLVK
ncbi:MAG: type III-B CRISPR module RAMP protein Cmr6 [Deltaproteobacteria bacterium]|nr:MAG: type III-B CRISPR module RAMP protein Cmr6 [Deltaproteobacteria bacterium]